MSPRTAYRACNICEACCGLAFEVEGDRILSVRGDEEDPFSRGYLCPKGLAMKDLHEDPDRLRRPLVRRPDGSFAETTWDDALERAAAGLAGVIARHGRHALAHYVGNPTVHNLGGIIGTELFRALLPSKNRYTANSQDANPQLIANTLMFGLQLAQPIPDLSRARYLLVIGANPLASNGSLMTAPGVGARLRAIQKRGGRIVVIDPRRTETAEIADEWLAIRPGADALLLLAIARTLLEEGLADRAFLARWTTGAGALPRLLEPFAPERVAPRLGGDLDAAAVRRLAREVAAARPSAVYGRVGICHGRFAGLAAWGLHLVNALAGNLDREGGMMFPDGPASHLATTPYARGSYARYRSPQGFPEVSGEWPCVVLAEQIERGLTGTPARDAVHGLVVFAGNPVLSAPNGPRIARAIERLEFTVALDIFLGETARLAHVVLPPRSVLHEPHFDLIFTQLSVENFVRWSEPVLPPSGDQPSELEIIRDLAVRTVDKLPFAQRTISRRILAAIARRLTVERVVDLIIRTSPLGDGFNPLSRGLNLARLRAHPHGLPVRPLAPGLLAKRVKTPEGKIRLAPAPFVEDLPRLAKELEREPDRSLVLIGRRHLKSNNTWLHNVDRLRRGNRCTLLVHPEDAAARGLADGDRARVRSRVSDVEVVVELTEAIAPGVVSLPHGWGHAAHAGRLARGDPGASANDVTDEGLFDPLSGNAALSGVPVDVIPVRARATARS